MPLASVPPYDVLYGNAERTTPRLSPDGAQVAYLAPVDGAMNLWLCPVEDPEAARPLTAFGGTGLRPTHEWSADGKHLVFTLDQDGNELFHVYVLTLASGEVRDVTPFPGAHARVVATSAQLPGTVLVALNRDDPTRHDYLHLALDSGELTPVQQGAGHLTGFGDALLQPRVGMRLDEHGNALVDRHDGQSWVPLLTLGAEDALGLYLTPQPGLSGDGTVLHLLAAAGADTAGLLRIDLATAATTRMLGVDGFDLEAAFVDPVTRLPLAVAAAGPRRRWLAVDSRLQRDLDELATVHPGELWELTSSVDGSRWLATFADPSGPTSWVVWDRATRTATTLFVDRPALEQYPLGEMEAFAFTSRDGLTVHGYLTFPPGLDRTDLPTVLYVHGGPWQRDSWTWNPLRQLLATRGYLCVQVNFRGSTGFGRAFTDAGDREWAGRMHDDLIDAVADVVARGHADPKRVAIFGGSYGGYAALVGATFTPDAFQAAIAWCPPANLVTMIQSFPAYWTAGRSLWNRRVGDPDTEPEFLLSRSPLTRADQVRVPLLLVSGENDPRCPTSEADQFVAVLRERDIPHTYIVVPDEGHGFLRQENNIKLLGWVEEFLAEHLPVSTP